jgi:CO/xanthine dehydrogenase Mo-binding subunit
MDDKPVPASEWRGSGSSGVVIGTKMLGQGVKLERSPANTLAFQGASAAKARAEHEVKRRLEDSQTGKAGGSSSSSNVNNSKSSLTSNSNRSARKARPRGFNKRSTRLEQLQAAVQIVEKGPAPSESQQAEQPAASTPAAKKRRPNSRQSKDVEPPLTATGSSGIEEGLRNAINRALREITSLGQRGSSNTIDQVVRLVNKRLPKTEPLVSPEMVKQGLDALKRS